MIPAGFEPATVRLEGECSIQLSYYDLSATKMILTDFFKTCKLFLRKNIEIR